MKKRMMILCMAVVMVLSMAGCGSAEEAAVNETAVAEEEEQEPATIAEEEEKEPVEAEEPEIVEVEEPEPAEAEEPEPVEEPEPRTDADVVETVDLAQYGITGTETRYDDGTSDYDISFSADGGDMHFFARGWGQGMEFNKYPDVLTMDYNGTSQNSKSFKMYRIIIKPWGDMAEEKELAYMSDKEISAMVSGVAKMTAIDRVETEDYCQVTVPYVWEDMGFDECNGYSRFIEHYGFRKNYNIRLHSTPDYVDGEFMLNLLDGVTILGD